jgi:hypothetical protein
MLQKLESINQREAEKCMNGMKVIVPCPFLIVSIIIINNVILMPWWSRMAANHALACRVASQ